MGIVSPSSLSNFSFKTAPVNYQSAVQNTKVRVENETPSGCGQAASFAAQAPLFAGLTFWRKDPSQILIEQVQNARGIRTITQGNLNIETLRPVIDPASSHILPDAKAIQKLIGKDGIHFAPAVYGQAIRQAVMIGRVDILRMLLAHAKPQALQEAAPALLEAILFRPSGALYLNDIYHFKAMMLDLLLSSGVNPVPQSEELLSRAIAETSGVERYMEATGVKKENDGWYAPGAYMQAIQEIKAALLSGDSSELLQYPKYAFLQRLIAGLEDWTESERYLKREGQPDTDVDIAAHVNLLRRGLPFPWRPD